jgi:hypothetical protein
LRFTQAEIHRIPVKTACRTTFYSVARRNLRGEEYESALPSATLPLQQHVRVTLQALLAQLRGEYAAADGLALAAAACRGITGFR